MMYEAGNVDDFDDEEAGCFEHSYCKYGGFGK